MNYPVWPDSEATGINYQQRSTPGINIRPPEDGTKSKYAQNGHGASADTARNSGAEDCVARTTAMSSSAAASAAATSFPDDDSLLKVKQNCFFFLPAQVGRAAAACCSLPF